MNPLPNRDEHNGWESTPDSSAVVLIEVRGNEDSTTRPLRPVLRAWAQRQAAAAVSPPEAPRPSDG